MQSSTVIVAEGLGKRYRLGQMHHDRLAALVTAGVHAAAAAARRAARASLARPDPVRPAPPADETLWALRDVSFEVPRGSVLGVIGRNGAGKSTLLKILTGITEPTEGRAVLRGRIASLLEVGTGFHPELTGRENVFLNGAVLGMRRAEIRAKFDDIVAFAELEQFVDTPVKRYSSGMYVRLAFAVAAHLDPEILLVDEVLAVGDLAFQKKCLGKMSEVTRGGRTVLFVSHNMSAVAQLTDRCLVLDHGRLDFLGATDEAIRHYVGSRAAAPSPGRTPVEQLACERRLVIDARARFTGIGLAAGQRDELPIGGTLRIEAAFDAAQPFPALRIGYTILDEMGAAVTTGWSPPFPAAAPGSHVRVLALSDLWLAPGRYALSMALLTGGVHEPKYVYDMIQGFGSFTVTPFTADHMPIGAWNRGWGPLLHTHSSVEEATP